MCFALQMLAFKKCIGVHGSSTSGNPLRPSPNTCHTFPKRCNIFPCGHNLQNPDQGLSKEKKLRAGQPLSSSCPVCARIPGSVNPRTVDLSSVSEDKPTLGDLHSSLELVLCEVLHGHSLFPLAGVRAPQATQDQRQDCEGCLLIPTRAQPAVLGSPSSPVPTPGETPASGAGLSAFLFILKLLASAHCSTLLTLFFPDPDSDV